MGLFLSVDLFFFSVSLCQAESYKLRTDGQQKIERLERTVAQRREKWKQQEASLRQRQQEQEAAQVKPTVGLGGDRLWCYCSCFLIWPD